MADSTDRASLRGSFGWEASFAALAAAAGRTPNDVPQLVEFSKFMKMKNLFDGMDYYPDSYVLSDGGVDDRFQSPYLFRALLQSLRIALLRSTAFSRNN